MIVIFLLVNIRLENTNKNITESLNYDHIKNDYKERFRKMIFPESKFDDINEHLVSEYWLKDYMKTQNNGNIRTLELIFDNDGN